MLIENRCQIRPTADIFASNSFKKCALIPVNNDLFCSVLARPSNFGSSVLRVLGLCFFCESRKNSFTDVCCVFKYCSCIVDVNKAGMV